MIEVRWIIACYTHTYTEMISKLPTRIIPFFGGDGARLAAANSEPHTRELLQVRGERASANETIRFGPSVGHGVEEKSAYD